jgi:outer membrane protein assembly factor BamB
MSAVRTAAAISAAFTACFCLLAGKVGGEPTDSTRQTSAGEAPWPKIAADRRNSGVGPACRLQGRIAWKVQLPSQIAQSPIVGLNERVFAACLDGTVICINGDTGHEVWRSKLNHGVTGAPAVADAGILVVTCSDAVYGMNSEDGTRVWQWKPGGDMSGSVGLGSDGTALVTTRAGKLACLDCRSGRLKWSTDGADMVASCPASHGGRVYCTDMKSTFAVRESDGQLVRSRSLNNRTTTLPSLDQPGNLYTLDGVPDSCHLLSLGPRGTLRWSAQISDGYYRYIQGPSVSPENLVTVGLGKFGESGGLVALDPATGHIAWNKPLPDSIEGAPAISANGWLFACCADGQLYAFETATGAPRWSCRVGAQCITAPAIGAHDRVYLGTVDNMLYGIE